MTKILDTENIAVINAYLGLKRNNFNTDVFLENAKDIIINTVDEIENLWGEYYPLVNEINVEKDNYEAAINHELMHAATGCRKYILFLNHILFAKISSSRFCLFDKVYGYGFDESITGYLDYKTGNNSVDKLNLRSYFLFVIGLEIRLLFNQEEYNKLVFSKSLITFYYMLIKKIVLSNTLALLKNIDKYYNKLEEIDETQMDISAILIGKIIIEINKKYNIKLNENDDYMNTYKIMKRKYNEKSNVKK